ncbi:hypothetical protein [Burkholderia ambifaria]|uniref:hypothetical protein n=1 Tax=Burkholderia ambifaria TaxID=152480 RepID=UPI000A5EEBF7|nr:hypothetical protein [Burkholderia ambifaria]
MALVERYRGKRNVLVAHSLGSGSTLLVLEWLTSRGRLREVDAALVPGTQLAWPGRRCPRSCAKLRIRSVNGVRRRDCQGQY